MTEPEKIVEMVNQTKAVEGYQKMPILFNEDDHFDFDKDFNNLIASISSYASWGYFDFRKKARDLKRVTKASRWIGLFLQQEKRVL